VTDNDRAAIIRHMDDLPVDPKHQIVSAGIGFGFMATGVLVGLKKGHPVVGWVLGSGLGGIASLVYLAATGELQRMMLAAEQRAAVSRPAQVRP
jgi:hypothetical protein